MDDWTDVDYAQAAIDMLPNSVEEIAEFLDRQGVRNRWVEGECPLTRWVRKWTDSNAYAGWTRVTITSSIFAVEMLPLPQAAQDYIMWVDRL